MEQRVRGHGSPGLDVGAAVALLKNDFTLVNDQHLCAGAGGIVLYLEKIINPLLHDSCLLICQLDRKMKMILRPAAGREIMVLCLNCTHPGQKLQLTNQQMEDDPCGPSEERTKSAKQDGLKADFLK